MILGVFNKNISSTNRFLDIICSGASSIENRLKFKTNIAKGGQMKGNLNYSYSNWSIFIDQISEILFCSFQLSNKNGESLEVKSRNFNGKYSAQSNMFGAKLDRS